jgi:hypothetical protein
MLKTYGSKLRRQGETYQSLRKDVAVTEIISVTAHGLNATPMCDVALKAMTSDTPSPTCTVTLNG